MPEVKSLDLTESGGDNVSNISSETPDLGTQDTEKTTTLGYGSGKRNYVNIPDVNNAVIIYLSAFENIVLLPLIN